MSVTEPRGLLPDAAFIGPVPGDLNPRPDNLADRLQLGKDGGR